MSSLKSSPWLYAGKHSSVDVVRADGCRLDVVAVSLDKQLNPKQAASIILQFLFMNWSGKEYGTPLFTYNERVNHSFFGHFFPTNHNDWSANVYMTPPSIWYWLVLKENKTLEEEIIKAICQPNILLWVFTSGGKEILTSNWRYLRASSRPTAANLLAQ